MAPSGNACAQMTGTPLVSMDADVIGGFAIVEPKCGGCGQPLLLENAWMTDGCPCNCVLGTNNRNETRWRLLMQLQQQQSRELTEAKGSLRRALETFKQSEKEYEEENDEAHKEAAQWKSEGDMYGWNFHEGRSGGMIWASIIFSRVRRVIEDAIGEKK